MTGYLRNGNKAQCFGCEACTQICGREAVILKEDEEGFRYPQIDNSRCVECGRCHDVCPYEKMPSCHNDKKYVFGGYSLDEKVRFESTSGGAFSVIADSFCDENYVIFGAEARGVSVHHGYITDKGELYRFRKSKYLQSMMNASYNKAGDFLQKGKKVLFSGTPCQIAGLKAYLGNMDQTNLLTLEVICEGVPSPLYIRKYEEALARKSGSEIDTLDYRYTGKSFFKKGKWDFQIMKTTLKDKKGTIVKDRWFNPFWNIWLNHLMSRPSCYECPFTTTERIADISLGDLWGVHLYCPELYGDNGGSSLVVCNTEKGKEVFGKAQENMYGHELRFEDALKYQSPMRQPICENPDRESFMNDLKGNMDYDAINKKWGKRPTIRLLWEKYIWGNRQKVFFWKIGKRR